MGTNDVNLCSLYSITDNEFVYRNNSQGEGELLDTSTFVDSLTQSVTICLVFFTPRQGLTTVLNIHADFSAAVAASVSFEVMHFGILEGDKLFMYLIVQSLVLFNVVVLVVDAIWSAWTVIDGLEAGEAWPFEHLFEPFTDVFSAMAIIAYVVLRFPPIIASASVTQR